MYRVRTPAPGFFASLDVLENRLFSAHRKAANVLPDPVGEWISVCSPRAIAGQACRCGGVGSPISSRNQSATHGKNSPSASSPGDSMSLFDFCRLVIPGVQGIQRTRGHYLIARI